MTNGEHEDDICVNRLADAMKERLAKYAQRMRAAVERHRHESGLQAAYEKVSKLEAERTKVAHAYTARDVRCIELEEERKMFIAAANGVAGTENWAWTAALALVCGKLELLEKEKNELRHWRDIESAAHADRCQEVVELRERLKARMP